MQATKTKKKTKTKKRDAKVPSELVEQSLEVHHQLAQEELEKAAVEPVYSFPSKSRCPRCQSTDTKVIGYKHKRVSYRQCQRAICRRTYKVVGTKI